MVAGMFPFESFCFLSENILTEHFQSSSEWAKWHFMPRKWLPYGSQETSAVILGVSFIYGELQEGS